MNSPYFDNLSMGVVDYEYLLYLQERACEEEYPTEEEYQENIPMDDGGDGEPPPVTADDILRELFKEV